MGNAAAMGADLLTEQQYQQLQQTGEYDLKTSTWLKTPPEVRKLGGSIFGDRRYGRVFIYHNGAQSYYASRGFRVRLPNGAEMMLVRERLGRWFADEPIGA